MPSGITPNGVAKHAATQSPHPGFDLPPLSAPPEIEPVGWISGKGV